MCGEFDADGSRQLRLPEYIESMRFIGKREDDDTLAKVVKHIKIKGLQISTILTFWKFLTRFDNFEVAIQCSRNLLKS